MRKRKRYKRSSLIVYGKPGYGKANFKTHGRKRNEQRHTAKQKGNNN